MILQWLFHMTLDNSEIPLSGADPGFLEKGVYMYKDVRGVALLILSHFS